MRIANVVGYCGHDQLVVIAPHYKGRIRAYADKVARYQLDRERALATQRKAAKTGAGGSTA